MRRVLLVVVFIGWSCGVSAQTLTPAQKVTLKADIVANSDTNTLCVDGNLTGLAGLYNAPSNPVFTVWKTNVPIGTVGNTFNAAELAGLTQLNTSRLQNLAAWLVLGINPSLASVRQFFDDVFSGAGGVNTRAALLVLWKRTATRFERVFATGTGSVAVPGLLVIEAATVNNGTVTGTVDASLFLGPPFQPCN